jgi:hypothetical protein
MPSKSVPSKSEPSKSEPSKKTAPAKKAAPAAAPAVEPTAETGVPADAEATVGTDGAGGTEERPLNRAERRAKGKSTTAAQPTFRGKVVGGHGPAHTQRMWSNRRSGG